MEELSPLIDARDVRELLNRPEVIIVDARGGPDAFERYRTAHLEGAIFADLETDLSQKRANAASGGRHPLPDKYVFGSFLANIGISEEKYVLVYDDKAGANAAARFWWMLKAAGHRKVQVINGGLTAMVKESLPISEKVSVTSPLKGPYPINHWGNSTVEMEDVANAEADERYLVLDVREDYRYKGEREPIDLIAGHIPGARNLSYLNNLEQDGTFRTREVLAELYDKLIGERDKQDVIVHCGSGVTACHTLLAMEYAGIKNVSLYVGSWSEWSRNNKPIATGDSPIGN